MSSDEGDSPVTATENVEQQMTLLKRVEKLHEDATSHKANLQRDTPQFKEWVFAYFDLNMEVEKAYAYETKKQLEMQAEASTQKRKQKLEDVTHDEQFDDLDESLQTLETTREILFGRNPKDSLLTTWKKTWEEERPQSTDLLEPEEKIKVLMGTFESARKEVEALRSRATSLRAELSEGLLTEEEQDERKRDRRGVEFQYFNYGRGEGQLERSEKAFDKAKATLEAAIKEYRASISLPATKNQDTSGQIKRWESLNELNQYEAALSDASLKEPRLRIEHTRAKLLYLRAEIPKVRQQLEQARNVFLQSPVDLTQCIAQAEKRRQLVKELHEMEREVLTYGHRFLRALDTYMKSGLANADYLVIEQWQTAEKSAQQKDDWLGKRSEGLRERLTRLQVQCTRMADQRRSERNPSRRADLDASFTAVIKETLDEFNEERLMHGLLIKLKHDRPSRRKAHRVRADLQRMLPSFFKNWMNVITLQRQQIRKDQTTEESRKLMQNLDAMLGEVHKSMHSLMSTSLAETFANSIVELRAQLRVERTKVRKALAALTEAPDMQPKQKYTLLKPVLSLFDSKFKPTFNRKSERLTTLYDTQLVFLQRWGDDLQAVVQQREDMLKEFEARTPKKVAEIRINSLVPLEHEVVEHESDKEWLQAHRKALGDDNTRMDKNGKISRQFEHDRKDLTQRLEWERKRLEVLRNYLTHLPEETPEMAAQASKAQPSSQPDSDEPSHSNPAPEIMKFPSGDVLSMETVDKIAVRLGVTRKEIADLDIKFLHRQGGNVRGHAFCEETHNDSAVYHYEGGKSSEIFVVGFGQLKASGKNEQEVRKEIEREKKRTRAHVTLDIRSKKYNPLSLSVKPVNERISAPDVGAEIKRSPSVRSGGKR